MTKDEHAIILGDIIANVGDQAAISEKLTVLSEDYGVMTAQAGLLAAENEKLKKENAKLTDANMSLFLKVGGVPEEKPEDEAPAPLTYDNLFDENGNLK